MFFVDEFKELFKLILVLLGIAIVFLLIFYPINSLLPFLPLPDFLYDISLYRYFAKHITTFFLFFMLGLGFLLLVILKRSM